MRRRLLRSMWDAAWEQRFEVVRDLWHSVEMFEDDVVCRTVLSNAKTFSSNFDPGGETSRSNILFQDPPHHSETRIIVAASLPPLEAFEETIHSAVSETITKIIGRETFDVVTDLAEPLAALGAAILIGVPAADIARFRTYLSPMARALDPTVDSSERRAALVPSVALMRYFDRLRSSDRAGNGALSRLFGGTQGKYVEKREGLAICVMLAHAAYENTANFLSYVAGSVLIDADLKTRLASADPPAIRRLVERLLYESMPVRMLLRRATERHCLAGREIDRDGVVCLLPSRVRRERTVGQVGFGHGPHACLGAPWARREAFLMITGLAGMKIGATIEDIEWKSNPVMFGPAHLVVRTADR